MSITDFAAYTNNRLTYFHEGPELSGGLQGGYRIDEYSLVRYDHGVCNINGALKRKSIYLGHDAKSRACAIYG